MKDVKRLQKYLDSCKQNEKSSTGEKREFWVREVRKTSKQIADLTK